MKIYIITGELSGEKHAADLVKALHAKTDYINIRGCGSSILESAGCEIAFDYRKYAIMGFSKVIMNLQSIKRYMNGVEKDIHHFNPDAVIMVDYPGFNLRLASKLFNKYPLYYYIAPKVWAWNTKRVEKIRAYFKEVYSILPFEIEFYKKHHVPITYVGNPSVHQVISYIKKHKIDRNNRIALLPGSRIQEIERMLPIMLEAVDQLGVPYWVSKAPNLNIEHYDKHIKDRNLLKEDMYELLHGCSFAFVTSGTATLETALFDIPQIVCYKADLFSYYIGKLVVKVDFISLVNLITGRETVPELIQQDCNPDTIREYYNKLNTLEERSRLQKEYGQVRRKLGIMNPSENAAHLILQSVQKDNT